MRSWPRTCIGRHGVASGLERVSIISLTLLRRPEESVLRQVLREHLPAFKARVEEADRPLPAFVERELEAIIRCGDPQWGVSRWICDACGHEQILPLHLRPLGCAARLLPYAR